MAFVITRHHPSLPFDMAVRAALEVNKRSLLTSLTAASALLFSAGAALATDKPVLTIHTYDSFASEWGPGSIWGGASALKADIMEAEGRLNFFVFFKGGHHPGSLWDSRLRIPPHGRSSTHVKFHKSISQTNISQYR